MKSYCEYALVMIRMCWNDTNRYITYLYIIKSIIPHLITGMYKKYF